MLLNVLPLQLWPEKFQNKTNGVTPRRWLSFCNPELNAVITKWLGSEEWVLDTEQLAGLRNVRPVLYNILSSITFQRTESITSMTHN